MHRDPRLSLPKIIIAVLSLLLLVLSAGTLLVTYRASVMADQPGIQSPTSTRQISSSGHNSITPPIGADGISPSPTLTGIPSLTPPIGTPSPTSTRTPTPKPTRTPSPKPTNTPTPKPTNTPPSSPVATATSPPPPTATPAAHATPGANASATPGSDQSGGQGSTPTNSSTGTNTSVDNNGQGTSPNGQGSSFPFLGLVGGVSGSIIFLFLLFIGWQLLRRHLMPVAPVKFRPSGAPPWSRERPGNPLSGQGMNNTWNPVNNNRRFTPPGPAFTNGYSPVTSAIMPHQGIRQGFPQTPMAGNFAPSNGNFPPVTGVSSPPATDGFTVLPRAAGPERTIPFRQPTPMVPPMNNTNGTLPPAPPVTNGQWTGNPPLATPDVNDPFLRELMRQYRENGSAPGQPMGQP